MAHKKAGFGGYTTSEHAATAVERTPITCDKCEGKGGYMLLHWNTCSKCKGKKFVDESENQRLCREIREECIVIDAPELKLSPISLLGRPKGYPAADARPFIFPDMYYPSSILEIRWLRNYLGFTGDGRKLPRDNVILHGDVMEGPLGEGPAAAQTRNAIHPDLVVLLQRTLEPLPDKTQAVKAYDINANGGYASCVIDADELQREIQEWTRAENERRAAAKQANDDAKRRELDIMRTAYGADSARPEVLARLPDDKAGCLTCKGNGTIGTGTFMPTRICNDCEGTGNAS